MNKDKVLEAFDKTIQEEATRTAENFFAGTEENYRRRKRRRHRKIDCVVFP